ncbi:MAG: YXWGXW repeat-containing protein [Terracidiphilus sp.]|nr:YXWGXW repeat-containing protein [Terracidiphilus sp.]
MKKFLIAAVLASALLPAASSFGQVVIRVGPPAPIVEHPAPRPGAGYVWVSGYHRWDGQRYVWVPGRWDRPPRPRARWVPAHYAHRRGGWVFIEGHWR